MAKLTLEELRSIWIYSLWVAVCILHLGLRDISFISPPAGEKAEWKRTGSTINRRMIQSHVTHESSRTDRGV